MVSDVDDPLSHPNDKEDPMIPIDMDGHYNLLDLFPIGKGNSLNPFVQRLVIPSTDLKIYL